MYRSLMAVVVLATSITIHADDSQEKAKAALALAKAQRERAASKESAKAKPLGGAGVQEGCFESIELAEKVSKLTKKPLVVWVGMTCHEAKDVCSSIADDAVSVHVKTYRGSDVPRIVFHDPDGQEYRVLKTEINGTTPIGIRKRMGLPVYDSPFQRAIIVESKEECSNGVCWPRGKT
jgi:hypothetical protein